MRISWKRCDHLADTATFPSLIPKVFPAGFERERQRWDAHTVCESITEEEEMRHTQEKLKDGKRTFDKTATRFNTVWCVCLRRRMSVIDMRARQLGQL